MKDNDEIDLEDEVLESAAGGIILLNHPNTPPTNYSVNQTIYFQANISDTSI